MARRDPARRDLLLVEDDPATSRALRTLLRREGWKVEVATTLAEGLRLAESMPRWIVLDLMLPDGDGSSLLRKVREEGWEIRVAVTTGSSDSGRLRQVSELRPDLFLFKPIDLRELLEGLIREPA